MADDKFDKLDADQLARLLSLGGDNGVREGGSPSVSDVPQVEGYRIERKLGEGGFGEVFLAEQIRPIRRRVALKVIKPGMDSRAVIARFEAERQALALLEHAHIAQVFGAGATQAGLPYFIMEYIDGISITEYCDRHHLGIEERLSLFLQVCTAIQHAHQKGIIHRDIKPSNILVSEEDGRPTPKIIDFGIAKALHQRLTEHTLFTGQGQLIGTPEYMSPEQAGEVSDDIDTRSDIYSLGVLLYELLTGTLPFSRETLGKAALAEIQRIIREEDPPQPSARLLSLGKRATAIAESRRTEAGILVRRLHRELEWIPLKAMRKERGERYRTAVELADDIQNYLNGDPLIAGPPTLWYQVRKYVRKHRAASIIVGLLLVIIVNTSFISLYSYVEAREALQESRQNESLYKERLRQYESFFRPVTFLQFLESWQRRDTDQAHKLATVLTFASEGSWEEQACRALLDGKTWSPQNLLDHEAREPGRQAFGEFVLAEYHLKQQQLPQAIQAYLRYIEDGGDAAGLDSGYRSRAKYMLTKLSNGNGKTRGSMGNGDAE